MFFFLFFFMFCGQRMYKYDKYLSSVPKKYFLGFKVDKSPERKQAGGNVYKQKSKWTSTGFREVVLCGKYCRQSPITYTGNMTNHCRFYI